MIQELATFRQKYPDYGDMDDATLADRLATKYPEAYGDLPGKVAAEAPQRGAFTPARFLSNIPKDAAEAVSGLYQAVRHPIQTGKAVLDTAGPVIAGGIEAAIEPLLPERARMDLQRSPTPARQAFQRTVQGIKDTSLADVGEWVMENPVDTLMLGVPALSGAGRAATAAGLSRTGEALSVASQLPVRATVAAAKASAKGAVKAARGSGRVGRSLVGRLSGTGEEFATQAIKAGERAFAENPTTPWKSASPADLAARGVTTGEEIVENAKGALRVAQKARGDEYRAALEAMPGNEVRHGMGPIRKQFEDLLERARGRVVREELPDGTITEKLDLSGNPWGPEGRRRVKAIWEDLRDWEARGDDTTLGLDALKRRIDDLYSGTSDARSFVTQMRRAVKGHIVNKVPEYAAMTKGYEEASRVIDDLSSGLMLRKEGLNGRVVADQTLRRLQSALKDNFSLRRDLVKQLDEVGQSEVLAEVAGYSGNAVMPHGLGGTVPLLTAEAYMVQAINPALWPALLMSSPRVAYETLRALGIAKGAAKSGIGALKRGGQTVVGKLQSGMSAAEEGKALQAAIRQEMAKRGELDVPTFQRQGRPVDVGQDLQSAGKELVPYEGPRFTTEEGWLTTPVRQRKALPPPRAMLPEGNFAMPMGRDYPPVNPNVRLLEGGRGGGFAGEYDAQVVKDPRTWGVTGRPWPEGLGDMRPAKSILPANDPYYNMARAQGMERQVYGSTDYGPDLTPPTPPPPPPQGLGGLSRSGKGKGAQFDQMEAVKAMLRERDPNAPEWIIEDAARVWMGREQATRTASPAPPVAVEQPLAEAPAPTQAQPPASPPVPRVGKTGTYQGVKQFEVSLPWEGNTPGAYLTVRETGKGTNRYQIIRSSYIPGDSWGRKSQEVLATDLSVGEARSMAIRELGGEPVSARIRRNMQR